MVIAAASHWGFIFLIEFGYAYPMGKALSTTKDFLRTKRECRSRGSVLTFMRCTDINPAGEPSGPQQDQAPPKPPGTSTSRVKDRLAIIACLFFLFGFTALALADSFDDSPPRWEALLWGGKVGPTEQVSQSRVNQSGITVEGQADPTSVTHEDNKRQTDESPLPNPSDSDAGPSNVNLPAQRSSSELTASSVPLKQDIDATEESSSVPLRPLKLTNIPPLYVTPHLAGEGVWESDGLPRSPDGSPAMYRTSYRPSAEYPNAIVHMLLFDMRQLSMRLYLGSSEPGAIKGASMVGPEKRSGLIAITNALWKQRHSGEAGTIFQGTVVKKLFPGMATLVIYKDGSVDILEWNDGIPVSIISDAKQLKHLIVKNGKVVDSVIKGGRRADSEIGMGYLLVEDGASASPSWPSYPYFWGYYGGGDSSPTHTSGEDWFIATRSAFGIRSDGNLVFAIGHHIGTKDLAKAMVLAGCERAIHGDANPHNVLANLYFDSENGDISRKARLSPDQRKDTLNRYIGKSYPSDFFAFFTRGKVNEEGGS